MFSLRCATRVVWWISVACGVLSATSATAIEADEVITAMVAEQQRAMGQLGDDQYPPPYYMAYAVKEHRIHQLGAKHGAMVLDDMDRARDAFVDVRVGDYTFDSSEDDQAEWADEPDFQPLSSTPLGPHSAGLRHALWLLTDLRYKQAAASFLRLKGRKLFEAAPTRDRASHAKAPPLVHYEPLLTPPIDLARWRALITDLSERLSAASHVFDSEVIFRAGVEIRWFVNSEGVRVRTRRPFLEFHAVARSRADDGMLLEHSLDRYAPSEKFMPSDEGLRKAAAQMLDELAALRTAPELGPYTGPALLAPKAAGVFFHEVLGHRLEAHRQDASDEGQTFSDHLGKPVVPSFLSVLDDPTRSQAAGRSLNGTYAVDDEGVQSQSVTLVDKGRLSAFLMGRRPAPGFDASNGHGRAAGIHRPTARMGNLFVNAHRTHTDKQLMKRLLQEVRRQRKPYGLLIRDLAGGQTNTSSYGYQAFKGEARMVYKVDAKTGRQTLVRGVDLVGTPLATLSKILAAGDTVDVFNGYCGAESGMVPVSTVAPALLFSEMELQRTARSRGQAPLLQAPDAKQDSP